MFVLTLNPHQHMNAWFEGLIHWSSVMTGIEWWGVLDVGKLYWYHCNLAPVGLDGWAHMICSRNFHLQSCSGMCNGCSRSVMYTWKATPAFGRAVYCSACWHEFIQDARSTEDAERASGCPRRIHKCVEATQSADAKTPRAQRKTAIRNRR